MAVDLVRLRHRYSERRVCKALGFARSTIRYLAQLFEAAGAQRIVTLDVHNRSAYENAFRIPAEHRQAMIRCEECGEALFFIASLPHSMSLIHMPIYQPFGGMPPQINSPWIPGMEIKPRG